MASSPSLSEQIQVYYKQKEPYLALLRDAFANMTSPSPEEIAAEYEKVSERIRDPDAPAKQNHKDTLYPDPRMPSKESLPQRKPFELKKEDVEGIDFLAIRKMMHELREDAAKGKNKEAKQAWADLDKMVKDGIRKEGKSEGSSGATAETKGKKKGKK